MSLIHSEADHIMFNSVQNVKHCLQIAWCQVRRIFVSNLENLIVLNCQIFIKKMFKDFSIDHLVFKQSY